MSSPSPFAAASRSYATGREGGRHGVLQARRVSGLDVLQDGFEGAAGDAPPLAPAAGVMAAAGLDGVGGGELAPVEVRRPQHVVVGGVPRLVPHRRQQRRPDAGDFRALISAGGR